MQKNVTPGRRKGCPNYPPELADRRAPRQGKNLETASTQEQNGHQHRIHESQHPGQGGAPISHHQATVRLRESQIQGVAEKR